MHFLNICQIVNYADQHQLWFLKVVSLLACRFLFWYSVHSVQ